MHTFYLSTREVKAGRSLSLRPALSTEFQDSQSYTEKPCFRNKQTNKQTKQVLGRRNDTFKVMVIQILVKYSCPEVWCVFRRLCLAVEASPSGAWKGIEFKLRTKEP